MDKLKQYIDSSKGNGSYQAILKEIRKLSSKTFLVFYCEVRGLMVHKMTSIESDSNYTNERARLMILMNKVRGFPMHEVKKVLGRKSDNTVTVGNTKVSDQCETDVSELETLSKTLEKICAKII